MGYLLPSGLAPHAISIHATRLDMQVQVSALVLVTACPGLTRFALVQISMARHGASLDRFFHKCGQEEVTLMLVKDSSGRVRHECLVCVSRSNLQRLAWIVNRYSAGSPPRPGRTRKTAMKAPVKPWSSLSRPQMMFIHIAGVGKTIFLPSAHTRIWLLVAGKCLCDHVKQVDLEMLLFISSNCLYGCGDVAQQKFCNPPGC